MLVQKYGGYVIEDKGAIVLVCTDSLCAMIKEKDQQAQSITFHGPVGGVSVVNYTIAIPQSAKIVSDWPSLRAAAIQRPHTSIVKLYGGFVIEEDGIIAIACDEKLSAEADAHPEQLEWIAEDVANRQ